MICVESFIQIQPKGVKRWEQVLSYSLRNYIRIRKHSCSRKTLEESVSRKKHKLSTDG